MQVKFRGKTESGEWVYGYLFEDENGCFIKEGKREHRYDSGIPVAPESIGMFIGRHDSKGNEIYGGLENDGGDICDFWAKDVARGEGFAFLGQSHVFYSKSNCAFYFVDYDLNEEPVMIADQILLIGTEIDNT